VVLDADGRRLAFAVVANGVRPDGGDAAELVLDRVGAALARCGCR
jgi:D-alanyl-D-alanine carboxypeptidase/D-alanyl-D-alanine-endopeptidase (penicillin-binding protein 4)